MSKYSNAPTAKVFFSNIFIPHWNNSAAELIGAKPINNLKNDIDHYAAASGVK